MYTDEHDNVRDEESLLNAAESSTSQKLLTRDAPQRTEKCNKCQGYYLRVSQFSKDVSKSDKLRSKCKAASKLYKAHAGKAT